MMARRCAPFVFVFVIALAGFSPAQERDLQENQIKVQWHESTLQLTEGGRKHEVSIQGQYDAVEIESVKLKSARQAKGFIYLLLDVTGPSKLPHDKEKCGTTSESDLIWLKLDTSWTLKEGTSFLYSSCLFPIAMVNAPAWDGDTFKVTTNSQIATFSSSQPEQGIKVTETHGSK